jgi:hypothetical protein
LRLGDRIASDRGASSGPDRLFRTVVAHRRAAKHAEFRTNPIRAAVVSVVVGLVLPAAAAANAKSVGHQIASSILL